MSKPPVVPSSRPDLAAGLARLRATTGKPERRMMHRVCSLHCKPFTITWERFDPRERFKIAVIEQVPSEARQRSADAKRGAAAEAFSAEEFDSTGLHCAWCSDESGSVYHPTWDTTYCGGMRLEAGGKRTFLCPVCNDMLDVGATDMLKGRSGERSRGGPAASAPAIEGRKSSLLPRWRK